MIRGLCVVAHRNASHNEAATRPLATALNMAILAARMPLPASEGRKPELPLVALAVAPPEGDDGCVAMKHDLSDLAKRFADALDRQAYDVVRALLAPDCRYDGPDGLVTGADEIIDSYRRAGRLGAFLFDTVQFESAVRSVAGRRAEIEFVDRLTKNGREHLYRCRQELRFTPGGLVSHIVNQELPGETQDFHAFLEREGVDLDQPKDGRQS
jgi:hypothetical protein